MTGGHSALRARVCGIGLVAPGLADWPSGTRVLAGREAWRPAPLKIPVTDLLPPAERRRAGTAIRLALACGHEAIVDSGFEADAVASVFASSDVDAENTHRICLALNESEPSLSPTRFHNSVQNAVSGYWTIATGSRAPTTMVMGGDEVLALGLLEAVTQAMQGAEPVLLVVFDVPMPAPLFATHPVEEGGAIALVLAASVGKGPMIALDLLRKPSGERPAGAGKAACGQQHAALAGLEDLRRMHPVGAALPLLSLLARSEAGGQTHLDYDRCHALRVAVEP